MPFTEQKLKSDFHTRKLVLHAMELAERLARAEKLVRLAMVRGRWQEARDFSQFLRLVRLATAQAR